MGRNESTIKKTYSLDQWETKLSQVKISKEDMSKLIMNYLVTEGYTEAAELFSQESGTSLGVDIGAITDRMEIRKAVQQGNVEKAIEKVNDMNPELLESQQDLFFHLQQQRLIELIRQGKVEQALDFAEEYLAPIGEASTAFLEDLERTLALLAFEEPASSPLGSLLDMAQRSKTAGELNAAILAAAGLEREPRLPMLLKMLMWAQTQLDERAVYPRLSDLSSGALIDPKPEDS